MYWANTRQYGLLLGAIGGGLILMQVATLSAPLFMRQFFNLLATHNPDAATLHTLTTLLILTGLMYLLNWIGHRLEGWSTMIMQARVMADLLDSAFGYLIKHSHNFFISRFAGSLTHRVNKFSKAYESLFDTVIRSFFPTFLFVTGAIVVLSFRSPILGLGLLVWVVLFVTFQIWVSLLRQPLRVARAEADTHVTGALADAVSNQSTILQFSGEKHEQQIFRRVVEKWRAITLRSWFADEYIWMTVGIFMIGIEIALLYGAVQLWSQGRVTIGDFILIQAYLLTTFNRLVSINRELRRFYDAFADASEMVGILKTPHEVSDKSNAKKLKVSTGEVWFDDVSFYFNKQTRILNRFNLKIDSGERIALVGPSGAGKSTVTKLLLRMFDVQEGAIKIGGTDISKVTQESLREVVAFVPQEPVLFHRTLMENIRYGRRDATDEEVIAAAKQAHCHEFISKLPETYNTFVGERGVKLSGGERQRVAIARALLKNSPILVLDEATSSLDSESESLIQDALETLMQGKTVVVIAHRLSTIMKMDRIIVVEAGSIAAQGTHLELVNQDGLYRKLWSIQAGGFIGDGHKPKGDNDEEINAEEDDEEEELAGDEKPQ